MDVQIILYRDTGSGVSNVWEPRVARHLTVDEDCANALGLLLPKIHLTLKLLSLALAAFGDRMEAPPPPERGLCQVRFDLIEDAGGQLSRHAYWYHLARTPWFADATTAHKDTLSIESATI